MNPRDLLRLVQIGSIELELRLLAAGGAPSSAPAAEMSERETAMRIAFCAEIGRELLDRRLSEPEVKP